MVGYKVANANSYVVVTGAGIDNVKIVKKTWVLPLQKSATISIAPFDFEITLQAMTIEKLQFSLPAVFTIGPQNQPEALRKYAMLLTGDSKGGSGNRRDAVTATGRTHVQEIVKGIIEGETRVIVSSMTMEEIFSERQLFKEKVIKSVQEELSQFGLCIYNANVRELQDAHGSQYFKFLSQKAHEGASNRAKVDVANARMEGQIGEAEKQGRTRQEISKIDAQTAVLETQRKSEKATADAELATTQTKLDNKIQLAKISASREAEARDAELQKIVELKRAEMELERRRATDVVSAKISKESNQQKSDAKFYADQKEADGQAYKNKQDAEAAFFRATKEAEAAYVAKKKEAEGIAEMARAYGEMGKVLGGPQGVLQFMMLQNGTYEKLANANAKAVQGLQPKISVWTTGEGGSGEATMAPIANLYKSLPPVLQTVQEQTGIMPPTWLAQMPNQAYGSAKVHNDDIAAMKQNGGAANGTGKY